MNHFNIYINILENIVLKTIGTCIKYLINYYVKMKTYGGSICVVLVFDC